MEENTEKIEHGRSKECSHGIGTRLATIEGHIRAVMKMLEEDKDCVDILTQLMAIERSVKKAGIVLLKNHMDNCIRSAVEQGDKERVSQLGKILEMYL